MFQDKLEQLRQEFDTLQRVAWQAPAQRRESITEIVVGLRRSLEELQVLAGAAAVCAPIDPNGDPNGSTAVERARSKGARQARRTRFHAMAEQGSVLVRMMDAGMSCRWANPALLAFTGRSLEQTVGDGWLQDVHHEDYARCVLRQPTDRHAFDRVEYRLRRGTGEYGWVLETRSPRLASRGSVGGYLANMVDITEHKQAGTNLALQYAIAGVLSKAKTAQDAAEIVQLLCEGLGWDLGELWSVDTEAHTQHCSHRWVSPSIEGSGRLGALSGQVHAHRPLAPWLAGAPLWIADIALDETLAREPEARLLGLHGMFLLPVQVHGETYASLRVYSLGVRQKNEAVAEVMLSAAVQLGGFLEHQRHLDRTRESEVRKAAMLDASLDAVITIDHQGQVVEFNSAAESIFGYRREQAVGRGIVDLIVPLSMRQQVLTGFAHYQATGESELLGKRFDTLAMKADGSQFPVEVAMAPIGHGDPPFVTIYLCDASERKQAETDILSYRERLQALMSDLLLVEERERRRLAIDLHDGLGQTIALARIKLAALQPSSNNQLAGPLNEIADLIEQANQTARSISFELSPPVLHDLGLEPALQWLVENIRDRYGLEIDLKHDSRPKPADERIRVILFRAIRELLINAAKHAGVRRVQVCLEREHDHLNALVEDDGIGMEEPTAATMGFGLFSIRERMSHVGGSMRIESAPGKGTRVRLRAPLTSIQLTPARMKA